LSIKRFTKFFLLAVSLIAGLLVILNLPVTSKQGVNYVVRTIRLPLYIKIIEFLDRDYHYKELVKRVCQGCRSDEDKVLALFKWTHQNIKADIPGGCPIIDDHAWHIVIRGYGTRDQFSDVFTTLCNYTGVDAFFRWVYTADRTKRISLSFVKIGERWCVFDSFNGSYFKNRNNKFADVEEVGSGTEWSIESLNGKPDIDYLAYFDNLPSVKDPGLNRANIQSPLNRLLFELKKLKG
jgi:hypothetical protein